MTEATKLLRELGEPATEPTAAPPIERDALLAEIAGLTPTAYWCVANADESGYCMEFSLLDTFHPEEECREWIARQDPAYIAANGYHAIKQERYTRAEELAREAAAALAQRNDRVPREPLREMVAAWQSKWPHTDAIPLAEIELFAASYAAPTGIPRDDARREERS